MPEIHPKLRHDRKGLVSFATAATSDTGIPMAGSQFFVTLSDKHLDYLDGKMAIFGQVAEGLEVLDKINGVLVDEDGMPYKDIRIKHTIILDDPFEDPKGLIVPDRSPLLTEDMLKRGRLGDEDDQDEPLDPEELERLTRQREAEARALTLEMVGDLPFAEIKPPENVLFVCKLNPVTRDEDLELIFSRFGKIISCEIVRDKKTNDSLCYAFVEFETKEACEEVSKLVLWSACPSAYIANSEQKNRRTLKWTMFSLMTGGFMSTFPSLSLTSTNSSCSTRKVAAVGLGAQSLWSGEHGTGTGRRQGTRTMISFLSTKVLWTDKRIHRRWTL